jgi:uncharacterized protein YydD (DUF2326 family)
MSWFYTRSHVRRLEADLSDLQHRLDEACARRDAGLVSLTTELQHCKTEFAAYCRQRDARIAELEAIRRDLAATRASKTPGKKA